jgi:hypothetical protein
VFVPQLLEAVPILAIAALAVGVLWCFVYLAAAAKTLRGIADSQSFGFADFFANIKGALPAGLTVGGIFLAAALVLNIVLPFYLGLNSIVGVLLAAAIFWLFVIAVLALQFFFAVHFRLGGNIPKSIKKCFIIFFDNPGLCVFSLVHNVIISAISLLLAFLAPGPAGVMLFLDEALRLRLLKYDYLEENPEANRKKIPWDALLIDEREKTGTRTLRNFIFPWKD